MQRTLVSNGLIVALFCLGCSGPQTATPRQAKTLEKTPPTQPACPAGSARVLRAGQTHLVSVQEAFSDARSGDAINLCPGRTFTDASLQMNEVERVTITGQGTSLVARGDFPVVQFRQCVDVTLTGVHVVHEVGKWCAHGCVEVYSSKKMTIRKAELDGSGYFGIVVHKVSASDFRDNLFHNCHYGFSAARSTAITLSGNTFKDNRGANIEVRGTDTFVNDVNKDNVLGPLKSKTSP